MPHIVLGHGRAASVVLAPPRHGDALEAHRTAGRKRPEHTHSPSDGRAQAEMGAACGMLRDVVIDGMDVPEDTDDPVDHVGLLLARVADGDQQAFAELYDMLSSRMLGLIVRVLVDRAQSEEVLQEVFLEIWQSADRFTPNKGKGRSWVFTITHRRAVDRVRSSQAASDRDVRVGYRDLGVAYDGVAEQVELRIEGQRVAEAVASLPEVQREALTLAYYGGYSQSEIAALVGAPIGTIKTRMRDGLSRLRTRMGVAS